MTPVLCRAHQGISIATAWRLISENGGCHESTCRMASHRSSNDTPKLLTPPRRTLPSLISRTISVPRILYRRAGFVRPMKLVEINAFQAQPRSEVSHSCLIDSGLSTRCGGGLGVVWCPINTPL